MSSDLDWFGTSEVGVAVQNAIDQHAAELAFAADAGEPPIMVIAPMFIGLIDERSHWGIVDRMVSERIGPAYTKSGRKPVPDQTVS